MVVCWLLSVQSQEFSRWRLYSQLTGVLSLSPSSKDEDENSAMGLPNLTPEEEYLLKKFALLKKKVPFSSYFAFILWHAKIIIFKFLFTLTCCYERSCKAVVVCLWHFDFLSQKKELQKAKDKKETTVTKPGTKRGKMRNEW